MAPVHAKHHQKHDLLFDLLNQSKKALRPLHDVSETIIINTLFNREDHLNSRVPSGKCAQVRALMLRYIVTTGPDLQMMMREMMFQNSN